MKIFLYQIFNSSLTNLRSSNRKKTHFIHKINKSVIYRGKIKKNMIKKLIKKL